MGQQPAPGSDSVPREQYDQLRNEMRAMESRLQSLERREGVAATQPAVAPSTQPVATEQEVRELRGQVAELQQDVQKHNGFALPPLRPGWEKPKGWMTPSFRADEMDLRVARAGTLDFYMGIQTAGRFQALDQNDVFINGNKQESLDPSFQTAWGDLPFAVNIDDGKMVVFWDLYISSRPHPSTTYGNEGYILIRELPDALPGNGWINDTIFKFVNVKAGHFEIDYGDSHYRRSDNAWVQRNLLIGNYLIDPDVEEIGMEIFSKPEAVNWLVGVSSGTTTENLNEGRGVASIHGKLWSNITPELRAAVSAYYVDHSDNPATGPGSTKGSLFSGRRSGGPYGGVFGGGNSPGEVFIPADQLVTAFQGDLTFTPDPWEFYGNFGWMEDADPNGSAFGTPENSWMYGSVEGAYHFTPRLYAAARYGLAVSQEINGVHSSGQVHRVQVGGGWWVTKHLLTKAEYVYETMSGFDEDDGLIAGVDASEDPSFHGLILEVSFAL